MKNKNIISGEVLHKAYTLAYNRKGFIFDDANKYMEIPFDKGVTEDLVMEDGMLGKWLVDNGFSVRFEVKDVPYQTKGGWLNYRGLERYKGHEAYLRNRLVAIVEW